MWNDTGFTELAGVSGLKFQGLLETGAVFLDTELM